MIRFLWVCAGGALGTAVRYLVGQWAPRAIGEGYPWATLIVNLVGAFLLGIVVHLGLGARVISDTTRFALATGVMGGLTTFSTFSHDTLRLLEQGAVGLALVNVTINVVGSVGLCWAGMALGRLIVGGAVP